MTTSARIILDSVSQSGYRLVTMQLVYPRFIHSEFMTHRVFSRNAASSRAIPVAKMIEQVRTNPATPIHWGANQPGMQARTEIADVQGALDLWNVAAQSAALSAEMMADLGLHKQVANRILEPFQWMHTIVSSTEWTNFFALRRHPDADPNIHLLADCMNEAMKLSVPTLRDWHMPYIADSDNDKMDLRDMCMISAARCARVSYLNHDGSAPNAAKDLVLAGQLMTSGHWSPFEHVAQAKLGIAMNANYRSWQSYRHTKGM